MKNDLLLVVLLVGWIAGSTYYYVCHIRKHCCGDCNGLSDISVFELTAPPVGQLRIVGEGWLVEHPEGVKFVRSESVPVIAAGADTAFYRVKEYLEEHTNHALHITGWYDNSEKNPGLYNNLGLARAEAMKRRLVAAGMPGEQVGTAGRPSIELTFRGDTLFSGLTFRVTDERPVERAVINPDTLVALEKRLKTSPPTLYFEMGSTAIPMSDSLERYLEDAQNYLSIYPDRSIVLTGHTDNVGRAEKNIVYGQERADFTKEALSKFGINPEQIKTRSEGEDQPIADNDTREGRSKNRRVEISIE